MSQFTRLLNSHIGRFFTEVATTVTSKQKLKQLLGISLYRNALYLIIANLAVPLTGSVFWLIAARFYSAEAVGLASAIIAAMGLLVLLSLLGLNFGLIRFLSHSGESANSMINSSFTIGALASIAAALIFVAGTSFWSPALLFLRQNPIYLAAFTLFTIASTLLVLVDGVFIAERRAGFALARGLIFGLLRLPLPILLAAFFHTFGIFASWGISVAIALVISVSFFLPRAQPGYRPFPAISRSTVNEMARFSSGNYLFELLWAASGFVLPIMVLNLLGAELNAYFYIAWAVGGLLLTIPLATSASLFAEGSYDEQRLASDIRRSLKLTFLILVPAVIFTLAIADKLLLLFGSSYSESGTTLLRIMALSAFPVAINYIYVGMKRVEKKLAVLIELSAFIAIATLTLSYLLLPRMGINGVGIAWLGSHGVIAVGIVASFLLRRPAVKKRLHRVRTFFRREEG